MEKSNENNNEEIIINKDNYTITISLKANILSLIINDSLNSVGYKANISQEFLSNKNIFFSYLTIIGIKDFFINTLKNQSKYNISNYNSNLKLTIFLQNSENLELIIPKLETQLNTDDTIILLKNENLNLKDDIKNLKEEISTIKNRLEELEKKISNDKNEWKGFTNKIIKNKDEVNQLLNWINPNEKYKVKLLYDANLEQNTNKDFHNKCDGKGATITLVESSKGKRFGGFTRISWNNNIKDYMTDANAFLFNLDKNKKFKVIKPQYAIYGRDDYGPHFGYSNDFTPGHPNGSKYFIGGSHPSKHNGNKTYEAEDNELSGENNFTIVSMEVYQVILDV